MDVKITTGGDFFIDANGDMSLTGSQNGFSSDNSEDQAVLAAQMAYMAMKTELSDFLLHPYLGNELHKILGLPNKEETGEIGVKLIKQALSKWAVPGNITVESYPIAQQKIRFEIKIVTGSPPKTVIMTLDKILNELGLE